MRHLRVHLLEQLAAFLGDARQRLAVIEIALLAFDESHAHEPVQHAREVRRAPHHATRDVSARMRSRIHAVQDAEHVVLRHRHSGAVERVVQHFLDGGVGEKYRQQRFVMGALEARLEQPTAKRLAHGRR